MRRRTTTIWSPLLRYLRPRHPRRPRLNPIFLWLITRHFSMVGWIRDGTKTLYCWNLYQARNERPLGLHKETGQAMRNKPIQKLSKPCPKPLKVCLTYAFIHSVSLEIWQPVFPVQRKNLRSIMTDHVPLRYAALKVLPPGPSFRVDRPHPDISRTPRSRRNLEYL